MAKHVWTVLCKDYVVDTETGNVTLFKALEQLTLIKAPDVEEEAPENIQHHMALVTLWSRSNRDEPESFASRYIFKSPTGKTIGSQEFLVDLKKHVRHRNLMRMSGIGFDGFGRYQFVLQKQMANGKWTRVAMIPLEVIKGKAAK